MAFLPLNDLWPTYVQAGTSACTAALAAASLWFIRQFATTTEATHQAQLKTYEDSTRPVLILVMVREHESGRFALYKNTGSGVAINICQTNMLTTYADDNVLAPGQQTTLMLPLRLDMNVIDIRYESLAGKSLCTISSFHKDGSIFNEYVPDAKSLGEVGIAHLRGACLSLATASMSRKFLSGEIVTSTGAVPTTAVA